MATLSQLHLARAATTRPLSTAPPRFPSTSTRATIPSIPCGILSLRISKARTGIAAATRTPENLQAQEDPLKVQEEAAEGVESSNGILRWLMPGVLVSGMEFPAHAVIPDDFEEMMRFSPEAWVNIYITSAISIVLYFLVIPLVIYNYLRLRWYKRNFLETYFQFMLVFVFFPGMLLLAPFINFRPLPRDGAEEP